MNIHTFNNKRDICINQTQLLYAPRHGGWIVPGGGIILDEAEALRYAKKLDEIIKANIYRLKRNKSKFI